MQVIIVLGHGLASSGGLSNIVRDRLIDAVNLVENVQLVIMSGRLTNFSGQSGEGDLMRDLFLQELQSGQIMKKIKKTGIRMPQVEKLVDAQHTLEQAYLCSHYLRGHFRSETTHSNRSRANLPQIHLITSNFHQERAFWVFRKFLGHVFPMQMHGVEHNLLPEKLKLFAAREQEILQSEEYGQLGCIIDDGNEDSIARYMTWLDHFGAEKK